MTRMRTVLVVAAVAALVSPLVAQTPAGGQKAPASPRETTRATIGTAQIEIAYGRPSKRGRQIWGGPLLNVPSAQVWRLGANQATTLKTSASLVFGSLTVPAGEYTLFFAHPEGSGPAKLIVNKQTGQWGTEYDAKQDLGRVDLEEEKLATPVEQLTITVEPQGQGGTLKIAWDDRSYSSAFTVK